MKKKTIKCADCNTFFTYLHQKGSKTRKYCLLCAKKRKKIQVDKARKRFERGIPQSARKNKTTYRYWKMLNNNEYTIYELSAMFRQLKRKIKDIREEFKHGHIIKEKYLKTYGDLQVMMQLLQKRYDRESIERWQRDINPAEYYQMDKERQKKLDKGVNDDNEECDDGFDEGEKSDYYADEDDY